MTVEGGGGTFDGGGEVLESRAELLVELLVGHELVRHEPGGQALVPWLVLPEGQTKSLDF